MYLMYTTTEKKIDKNTCWFRVQSGWYCIIITVATVYDNDETLKELRAHYQFWSTLEIFL